MEVEKQGAAKAQNECGFVRQLKDGDIIAIDTVSSTLKTIFTYIKTVRVAVCAVVVAIIVENPNTP